MCVSAWALACVSSNRPAFNVYVCMYSSNTCICTQSHTLDIAFNVYAYIEKKEKRACWFASFTVPNVLILRREKLNSVVLDFLAPEFFGRISESHAMSSMHGDPPTGRDKGIVAGKMCRKPRMACA